MSKPYVSSSPINSYNPVCNDCLPPLPSSVVPPPSPVVSEEDVYDEDEDDDEECGTDNEEEISYDKVKCINCNVLTHHSVGECSGCGTKFKMSRAGYLVGGEDGNFVCDEDEAIVYSGSDDDEEEEEEDDDEDSTSSSSSDDEMVVVDEEEDYVYKKQDGVEPDPKFRRLTRSRSTRQS